MLKESVSQYQIRKALNAYLGEKPKIDAISFCRGGFFNTTAKIKLKNHESLIIQLSPVNDSELFWHERHMLRRAVYFLNYLKLSDLPIARVYYGDFSRRIIPRDFVIFNELPGHNWHYYARNLSLKENDLIYKQLGMYARQIHAIKHDSSAKFGFPRPYKSFLKWSDFVLAYTKNLSIHNAQHRLIGIAEHLTPYSLAKRFCGDLDKITGPRLVQGDLWPRNILVREVRGKYCISGILDWERGLWGDPQFEWVLQCMNYGKAFWNAYGLSGRNFPGDFVRRSKIYQACFLFQAALEAVYCFGQRKKAADLISKMSKLIKHMRDS